MMRIHSSQTRHVARRRALIVAAAAVVSAAASAAFAGSVEFVGDNFGTGTDFFPVIVSGPSSAEVGFGTYSFSGGTTPGLINVASGGIDSALDLYQGASLLGTNDDLAAPSHDSEIRSTGYAGGRTGAGVVLPLGAGSYQVQLRRSTLNSGTWSLSATSTAGTVAVGRPTLNAGQTIQTINVAFGGDFELTSGALVATNTAVKTGGYLSLLGTGQLQTNLVVSGGVSQVVQADTSSFTGAITLGNVSGDAGYYTISGSATATLSTLSLAAGNASSGYFSQSGGTVTVSGTAALGISTSTLEHSRYTLAGGVFAPGYLTSDGSTNNVFQLQGGTLRVRNAADINLVVGQSLLWSSGTLEVTDETSTVSLRPLFGSSLTLTAGQTLSLHNAQSFDIPITLNGGTLSDAALVAGAPLTWNSGTLDFGSQLAQIGSGTTLGLSLTLGASRVLSGSDIAVKSDGLLTVQAGGVLRATSSFADAGMVVLGSAGALIQAPSISVSNMLSGSGVLRGATSTTATATVGLGAGDALTVDGTFLNQGTVRLTDGSIATTGTFTNASSGKVTGRGTVAAPTLSNAGVITFSAGVSDVDAVVTNSATGKVIVTGGGTVTVYRNLTNVAGSEFRVSANASAAFLGNVTGLSAFTGSGVKYFEGGTTVGSLMNAVGQSVVESSGSLNTAGIRESSLVIRGTVVIAADSPTSVLNTLTFDGGTLDLTNNKLIIDYDTASPQNAIRTALASRSLFSSSTPTTSHAVGYAQNSDANLNLTNFGGVNVDATSLLIRWTLKGDSNLDGTVNFDDLLALAQNYGATTGRVWSQGDSNYDGAVSFEDLLALAQNYGGSSVDVASLSNASASFAADWALARALVPEPTTLAALMGFSMLSLRRRR